MLQNPALFFSFWQCSSSPFTSQLITSIFRRSALLLISVSSKSVWYILTQCSPLFSYHFPNFSTFSAFLNRARFHTCSIEFNLLAFPIACSSLSTNSLAFSSLQMSSRLLSPKPFFSFHSFRTSGSGTITPISHLNQNNEMLQVRSTEPLQTVPIYIDLLHNWRSDVDVFNLLGRHVFSLCQLEDVFLAINNPNCSVWKHLSDISGLKEAFLVKQLSSSLRILVVSFSDAWPLDTDLKKFEINFSWKMKMS